jgi:integrase
MLSKAEQATLNLEQARDLRAAGASYREIGRKLTLTSSQLSHIRRALSRAKAAQTRLRRASPDATDLGLPVRRFLKAHRDSLARRGLGRLRPVFPMFGGQRYEGVRSVWFAIRREADLPPVLRIHDLRHSFASHSVMSGETLFATSRLLGHSRIQMTARYAHLADDALLTAAEKVGALLLQNIGLQSPKELVGKSASVRIGTQ